MQTTREKEMATTSSIKVELSRIEYIIYGANNQGAPHSAISQTYLGTVYYSLGMNATYWMLKENSEHFSNTWTCLMGQKRLFGERLQAILKF